MKPDKKATLFLVDRRTPLAISHLNRDFPSDLLFMALN